MNLKDLSVPELQATLQLMLDTVELGQHNLTIVTKLRAQRTYSRYEKQLISSLVKRFNVPVLQHA